MNKPWYIDHSNNKPSEKYLYHRWKVWLSVSNEAVKATRATMMEQFEHLLGLGHAG